MIITFHNSSEYALETVAEFAVAKGSLLGKMLIFPNGDTIIPRKKSQTGLTDIYTVKWIFEPGITEAKTDDINIKDELKPFKFSPWLEANPFKVIPIPVITLSNDEVIRLDSFATNSISELSEDFFTMEVMSHVIRGWKYDLVMTAYNDLDHVKFGIRLNWADQSNPNYNIGVKSIHIECGDEIVFHGGNNFNFPQAEYTPQIDLWSTKVAENINIRDGEGLELRGYVLTNKDGFISINSPGLDKIQGRLENLDAVKTTTNPTLGGVGEVVGLADNLQESWFWNYLPRFDEVPGRSLINPTTGNIFGARRIGMSKFPGQTGSQQDFGADKGFEATVKQNPAWITLVKQALIDGMRWFNIHEPTGDLVRKELHPNRITWNMETFDVLTKDTLGKPKNTTRQVGLGFMGYDTQHKSMNNLFTYYALTGDRITKRILLAAFEADRQQARHIDLAEREVGRTFVAWYKTYLLLPEIAHHVIAHCNTKFQEFVEGWRGRFLTNEPIQLQQVIIDNRSGIVNPNTGNTEPSWIPYQTAEMAKGLYAYYLMTGNDEALEVCKKVIRTVLYGGCFEEDGTWYTAVFCRYRTGLNSGVLPSKTEKSPEEGLLLDPSAYNLHSWEIRTGSYGFWDWTAPAIAIGSKILDSQEDRDRCALILNNVYPNGFGSMETAEWFMTKIR